jgi:uncharacterized repeat protein (TIGR03803 family)
MSLNKHLGIIRTFLLLLLLPAASLVPKAWGASEYKSLYRFAGGKDGASPYASLVFDGAGNLYGTTTDIDDGEDGHIFELTPNGNGTWTEKTIFGFGRNGGDVPFGALILDAAGNLYGTASQGGKYFSGTVFELTASAQGKWKYKVLHQFTGTDGEQPIAGVIFDTAGNLYGTTAGGPYGVVFQLTPKPDGTWKERVLHRFSGGRDGRFCDGGLVFDNAGNLYGTTRLGGDYGYGVVFELTPNANGSWTENTIHQFSGVQKDGAYPYNTLIFDSVGNLYGTTLENGDICSYGSGGCGNVFELSPSTGGSWTETVLYRFNGGEDGGEPVGGVIMDNLGNLYGTAELGGDRRYCIVGCGVVYELSNSNGEWHQTVLHQFVDDPGALPFAGLVLDQSGNLYGATFGYSLITFGSVFKVTPAVGF